MEVYYELEIECEIKIFGRKAFVYRTCLQCEDIEEVNEELGVAKENYKVLDYEIKKCVTEKTVVGKMEKE